MIKTTPAAPVDRTEKTPPVGVKWHPYADLFPWLEGQAYEELKADIAKNGVIEPIVFIGDAILDGRNRYMAARSLGIEYPRVEFTGDDPLAFVLAKNLARRHLTDRQRADVAAKIAKLPKGANQHTPIGGPSISEAARMMDVPVKAVERAKAIQEHASPDLKAAYEAGEVAPSAAAEVAMLPAEEQAKVVSEGRAVEAAKALREKRRAEKTAEQAAWDAQRADVSAKLNPEIKTRQQARDNAIAARKARAEDALQAELEELRESYAALEAEHNALKEQFEKFEDMRLEYERGGFEEVIANLRETLRVANISIERESAEKIKNLNRAEWWRKEAIKLGWSNDEVIELEGNGNG